MRKLQAFTCAVLVITTPTMYVYPQDSLPNQSFQEERDYVLSYDDMLRLLAAIESGELEQKCSPEELERVANFVAFLAKEGALPDDSEESLSRDGDIQDLLNGNDNLYDDVVSFVTPGRYEYMIVPTVLNGHREIRVCKSWVQKRWKHVKKFVKKHKKEILIGAVVVVAAAAVVATVVATSAGAAASESHKSDKKKQKEELPSVPADMPSGMALSHEAPTLKSIVDEQTFSFKENILKNQFFAPTNPSQGLSWEENGRVLGSLFAHDSFNNVQHQIPSHPRLFQEVQDINSRHTFSIPGKNQGPAIAHPEIDRKFATDYSHLYMNPGQEVDFNTLSHQVRGERALAQGYYKQAVQDLGKAIEASPANPVPYLERGIAHFGLKQYDRSLEDYNQFTSQTQKASTFSTPEFTLGFAKGLPKGVYESGKGAFLLLVDFVTHPVRTGSQMAESVSQLARLVRDDKWGVIAEALSPEIHQLATHWDTLSSDKRGELAGYALGKHGADILLPGALVKVASKSVQSAQELAAICKNLQIAQETFVLETAAGIGNSAKIAEVVEIGQKTAFLAEELGFSAKEMGKLKEAGKLETTLVKNYEHLSPSMRESIVLHKRAQDALKPYVKTPMPETKVRELIHANGITTFPRPKGIPENYIVTVSDKGAGIKYIHPQNEHTFVRVMPGKPHSPFPYQQKPYINQRVNGKSLDKAGKVIPNDAPEAHIPLEKFVYRGM
jgi:hypothetical protein